MPTLWDDPEQERRDAINAEARRQRVSSYRATSTQAQATNLAGIVSAYPHLSPQVAMPLALAGQTADSPVTAAAAFKAAKNNKKKRGVFGAIGDFAGDVVGGVADIAGEIGETATDILKPIARTGIGIVAAPIEEGTGIVRAIAANAGNIAAGAASGFVTGLATGAATLTPWGLAAGAIGGTAIGGVGGALAEMKGVEVEGEGWRPQSTLLTSLTGGGSMGQGYLPGGAAAEEAGERARETGRIGEHAFTPGRFFASAVLDEDTKPYTLLSGLIDATNAWQLDPTAIAGKRIKEVRKVANVFSEPTKAQRARQAVGELADEERLAAGLVDGARRPSIIRENAQAFLNEKPPRGRGSRSFLAEVDDYETARRILGKDVDPKLILQVLDNKTADEIGFVLEKELGIGRGLEDIRNFSGLGTNRLSGITAPIGAGKLKAVRAKDNIRFLGRMPSDGVKFIPGRESETIEQFTRMQQTAKLGREAISRNNEALARALDAGDVEHAQGIILRDFVGHAEGPLVKAGARVEIAKRMADRWATINEGLRRELIDDIAVGDKVPAVVINGDLKAITSPHLMSEALDDFLAWDPKTVQQIRRSVGMFSGVFNPAEGAKLARTRGAAGSTLAGTIDTTAWVTNKVWKVSALFRGSYITRNLAEAQARMGAAGLDTAFRHPLDYMAWVAGGHGRIARILEKAAGGARGEIDIVGRAFAADPVGVERACRGEMNHFAESIGIQSELGGAVKSQRGTANWRRGEPGHVDAVVDRMERLARDPIAQRLSDVRLRTADQADFPLAELINDPQLRESLETLAKRARRSGKATGSGQLALFGDRPLDLGDVENFANNARKQVQTVANGNSELYEAIATGQLKGEAMRLPNGQRNPKFNDEVKKLIDAGHGPDEMVGQALAQVDAANKLQRQVNRIYNFIDTAPMGKFTYGPAHKQAYWQEAKQMISGANRDAQRQMIEMAQQARMPEDYIRELRARASISEGELNVEAIHGLIDQRAGDQLKKLLYRSTEKSQLQDILRVVFPFMGAQMNSLKVWAKLGTENLAVPARVNNIFHGARGTGTFYKDPQTGEEMFAYPGSKFLTGKLLGVPIPLGGPVAGLNMFGSGILPGAGPMVQLPVRYMLPDKPRFDQLREFLDPYGESAQGGMIEQFAPPWLKRVMTGKAADPGDRAFGDAIFSIYTAGLSSGKYSNATPEAMAAGLDDAKAKARWLYVLEGAAAMGGAPTTPSHEFQVMDKDGRWEMMGRLKEEYQAFMDEDPRTAMTRFVDKFGIDVVAVIQPSTYTQGRILSDASQQSGQWAREHEDLVGDYQSTYGLFSPSVNSDDFDSQTWARQMREKERLPLDPEQRAKMINDKLAKTIFYNAKDQFGLPSAPQKEVLRALRTALRNEYPGFEEDLGLPERADTETKIAELERAVTDERLVGNPVIEPTKAYLAARAELNRLAVAAGRANINSAKDMAPYREILRRLGNALSEESPAFDDVWDRVFRNEIDIDEAEEAPVGVSA